MSRPIDADELEKTLLAAGFYPTIVRNAIRRAPTVSAEHEEAQWIEDDYGYYHCDGCGWEFEEREDSSYKFCPQCGARMGGTKDDE